ncbi:MAG: protein kinase [Kofleriaceae bacterium]|nr:protein kinase [Kofleriaceae bacterium]
MTLEVAAWLRALGLERYLDAFVANDIDGDLLLGLTDADLVALGVASLGHRKRLLAAITDGRGAHDHTPTRALRTAPPPARDRTSPGDALPTVHLEPGVGAAALWPDLERRGYVVEQRLGAGGMGEIYVARQLGVDRLVAVKILRAPDRGDGAVRFAREARAIAALQHPHTVRLYDYVAIEGGGSAIIMEYVEGETLWELMRRQGRLPVRRIVPILIQVCDALSEAHGLGIVHRDLKPANIVLQQAPGYRDFARVLDFGLARWADDEDRRLTRTGHVFGTPQYLSPEQAQGAEVTPQSDLYALGVILYEALAGALPFGADGDASLLYRHVTEVAPPLPPDVERPVEVDRLLERLLAKAPPLRPPSAAALRAELAGRIAAAPVEVRRRDDGSATPSTERRRVVVVDVRCAAGDDASHDAAHERLRRAHAEIERVRRRHGGFLNSRAGAHLQLVFGAPVARRDDVGHALDAALEVRAALTALQPATAAASASPPASGIEARSATTAIATTWCQGRRWRSRRRSGPRPPPARSW